MDKQKTMTIKKIRDGVYDVKENNNHPLFSHYTISGIKDINDWTRAQESVGYVVKMESKL